MTTEQINEQMEYIAEVMTNSMKRPHTIDKLAASLNISTSTLKKRFRQRFKQGILEYYQQQRMRIAAARLIHGATVKGVQIDLGYRKYGTFSAAFQKRYKMTPAKYSRRHGQPL
jgi:methylphosphotriester-DNA--protein-cysteine methyltransferase